MHPECHATVGKLCSDGGVHRRDSQGMRYEAVCRPWEGHTPGIGVGAVRGLMCDIEPTT